MSLMLMPASFSHGQSEPQAAGDLLMEHQQDAAKSVEIQNGTQLKVWTRNGQVHKGILNAVSDSSLTLGSQEIPFSKTEKVTVNKGEGSRIGGVVGIVIGAVAFLLGLAFGLIGGSYLANISSDVDGCVEATLGFFFLILGVVVGAIGLIFWIIGMVAYAAGKAVGRSFKFDDKWRLKRVKRP